jgi:hypothetical protein
MSKNAIITPPALLSYAHLFEPQMAPGADKAKYSCALVFQAGTDTSALKAEALATAEEKWGKKAKDMIRAGKLRMPFRDDIEEKGYPEGSFFINVRSDRQPQIVYAYPGPDGKPAPLTDPQEIYSGCVVRASVRAFAYDVSGNRGVSFALNNVQKISDGPRLDGQKAAVEEFDVEQEAPPPADLSDLL